MRWAYIIDELEEISISGNGCHFLESEITEVDTRTKEQEMAGRDGVLVGANTFGSFELILKFYYDGVDNSDLILFTEKIKRIIHTRNPMYVIHSDMPGRKYAFNSAKVEWEKITNSDMTFSISFNCYKGYSESLKDTSDIDFLSEYWQYENGVISEDIKYSFNNKRFSVYNGSSDTINPIIGHKLKIKINANAPNGFKITNHHTNESFIYNGSLNSNQSFILDGVHPLLNDRRVGYNTNYEWITLKPGYNNIEIEGINMAGTVNIEFIFDFIYR